MALMAASLRSVDDALKPSRWLLPRVGRGWRRRSGQRYGVLRARDIERGLTLASQERGEIELNGMAVDRFCGKGAGQDVRCAMRQPGIRALGLDAHRHRVLAI